MTERTPPIEPGSPQAQAQVEELLGHRFAKEELLRDALTHRSFRNENPRRAPSDNERLEFLGDALLGLSVAALLYDAFPKAPEGELTRKRADLVCEAGLMEVAEGLELGLALRLGKGEDRSGGRSKPRLLASALEAVLGAVFLDGGREVAFATVERLFAKRVAGATLRQDPKSALQEKVQAEQGVTPRYQLLSSTGPDHARTFVVALQVGEETIAEGQGRSKADAEQKAALAALAVFSEEEAVQNEH